jgi:hypothetical protein
MGRGGISLDVERFAPEGALDEFAEIISAREKISIIEVKFEPGYGKKLATEGVKGLAYLRGTFVITSGRHKGKDCELNVLIDPTNPRYLQLCKVLEFNPDSFLLTAMIGKLCDGEWKAEVTKGRLALDNGSTKSALIIRDFLPL